MSRVVTYLPVPLVLALSGCAIGTWPQPEGKSSNATGGSGGVAWGPEACNGIDDDADGAADEGCPCHDAFVRGCIGVDGSACGPGLQYCEEGGWQECSEIGEPRTRAVEADLRIVGHEPAVLVQNGGEALSVRVQPFTRCAGIVVQRVDVELQASEPALSVMAVALDDGDEGDTAGDGIFTAVLRNPFGPGVPPQELDLMAAALIHGDEVVVHEALALEEQP